MNKQVGNAILLTQDQDQDGKISEREITLEEMGKIFFRDGNDEWTQIHAKLPAPVWERLYHEETLVYEGFTLDHKALGAGRAFDQNGNVCMEGVFGIKGLQCGRAYYPNGVIRFEGNFKLNQAYGPNFPEFGIWYDKNGKELYRGKFKVARSSLGWPRVCEPDGFGSVPSAPLLKGHTFSWDDARRLMKKGEPCNETDE